MNCIDFDKKFEQYTAIWLKNNADRYKNNMDVLEGMMPDIYMEFMNKKATWLGGKTPAEYFEQYSNANELIEWMCAYYKQKVPVPDLLLERITALGSDSEDGLIALLTAKKISQEARMTAVSLLREIESVKPMAHYIAVVAAAQEGDEMADMCAESLAAMGAEAVEPILAALEGATVQGCDIFADILSNYPGDERIYSLLISRFKAAEDKRALFASYLAKYGDDRALDALNEAARLDDINYLDYVEVVSAIEALGGERPAEREFAGDPYYESLKGI